MEDNREIIEIDADAFGRMVTAWMIRREMETCPECYGRRVVGSGHGHFGDCNGDAGEGWKPCLSMCPVCLGRGTVWAGYEEWKEEQRLEARERKLERRRSNDRRMRWEEIVKTYYAPKAGI